MKRETYKKLTVLPIENLSGYSIKNSKLIRIKNRDFYITSESVTGDAPKDIIKMYLYGEGPRRGNPAKWKKYIAKYGHKWYPIESITEQLITRVGQIIGFDIANSHIVLIQNEVRFLSEHFHNNNQSLIHGAEIISRHLKEHNTHLIDTIEEQGKTKEMFDVDDLICAISDTYRSPEILHKFLELIVFDAIIGNKDRHFYNWGVIEHIRGKHKPYFSPIYDTARGFLWNYSESKIEQWTTHPKNFETHITKYVYTNSHPKVGIRGNANCNHFDLVQYLNKEQMLSHEFKQKILGIKEFELVEELKKEFYGLISEHRFALIIRILNLRLSEVKRILSDE